jgi:hypothetical protein
VTTNRRSELADRLIAGANGDPDQRAATQLLCTAARGVWLGKLDGWPEYLRALEDDLHSDARWVDWHQLREDLAADDHAWATFNDWANSYAGRRATEAEREAHLAATVPHRAWHGASSSELVLLRIALELAPGGLLGDGLALLDLRNKRAVGEALNHLTDG